MAMAADEYRSMVRALTATIVAVSLWTGGLAIAPAALAASQGAIGAASSGTLAIAASVPPRARLSGLNNVSFTNVNPANNARNAQSVCAWSNTATKGYRITASGSGAGNAFTLSAGALSVPYTVQWNGAAGRTSGTALTAGALSASFVSSATHQQCLTGPSASASLIIGIAAANLQAMQAATAYTGTLTLLMTPQ